MEEGVPVNQPLIDDGLQQGDQVPGLMSAGWTNERHSSYISSMEASFVEQLYGNENHGLDANKRHLGTNAFKVIQEGVCKSIRFERTDACKHDGGLRCLPENPWVRRFRPRGATLNRRSEDDGVDDCGSGTDTVRAKVWTHEREVKTCSQGNHIGKSKEVSDQNFSEGEVGASDEPCKRRKPTSSSAV